MRQKRAGLSLIEIMVALAVLSIVIAFVTQFFTSTTKTAKAQKAVTEANEAARTALSLIVWDLQNAGYRVTVSSTEITKPDETKHKPFLGILPENNGHTDSFTVRFLDEGMTPVSKQCVKYSLAGSPVALRRGKFAQASSASETCTATNAQDPTVASIVAMNLRYETRANQYASPKDDGTCDSAYTPKMDNGAVVNCVVPWAFADEPDRLVRQVKLQILARSTTKIPSYQHPKKVYTFDGGSTYTTEPGYAYYSAEQVVVTPNLGR